MIIRAGYDIGFHCPAQTSMLLHLNVHPDRNGDLRSPDVVVSAPHCVHSHYLDHFGNIVTRVNVEPGHIAFRNDFTIFDTGLPDGRPADAPLTPVSRLPDDVLLFLISSRYCDTDKLVQFAWSQFGYCAGSSQVVQAICDFVHGHIRFDYMQASATRSASEGLAGGVGVCRDFAHLAIALCRCMNVPARYATGYLGDIGVPADPEPMDFSAWFEVWLGGRWHTFDARHNKPRIGRIVMARGRDAADVALTTSFGVANLAHFHVTTLEVAGAA